MGKGGGEEDERDKWGEYGCRQGKEQKETKGKERLFLRVVRRRKSVKDKSGVSASLSLSTLIPLSSPPTVQMSGGEGGERGIKRQ